MGPVSWIPSLSLVVPVYNEGSLLTLTLPEIFLFLEGYRSTTELFIADDGSDALTKRFLEEFELQCSSRKTTLQILYHSKNQGKGAVLREAFLLTSGEVVGFLDADLQIPISQLLLLLQRMEQGADAAIASRRLPQSHLLNEKESPYRSLPGKILNWISRAYFVPSIRDTQCGMKVFRGSALRKLIRYSFINGFAFDLELLYLFHRAGYRIMEVPVDWKYRPESTVKVFRHGFGMLRDLLRIKLAHLQHE